MNMPECCIICPIYNGEYGKCNLIENSYSWDDNSDPFEERRKDCPLKEIENEKKDKTS